jgi:hypothetical protein
VLKEYRRKRAGEGRSEATCNRELSILRMALNLGRKCTPRKVTHIPYFPILAEANEREGFLTNNHEKLRDALPDYLRPLFVAAYCTGVRLGELEIELTRLIASKPERNPRYFDMVLPLSLNWSVGQPERYNVLAGGDGYVLLVVEHVGHGRSLPNLIGGKLPKRLTVARVDGHEGSAVFAEKHQA